LSDEDLATLRAFAFKTERHVTRDTYNSMPDYFPILQIESLESNRARASFLSGFKPVKYDCCANSCVLFVHDFEKLTKCPICNQPRFADDKPVKQFVYLPVTPRLAALYRHQRTAEQMAYRHKATQEHEPGKLRDYVDGAHYRWLLGKCVQVDVDGKPVRARYKYFSDWHDIALGLSTDGFAPFKRRKQTC
ncbi:hypothetical protein AURDEDRAFT_38959, partial [Auricularia subglabra TFB-10046 SS5]